MGRRRNGFGFRQAAVFAVAALTAAAAPAAVCLAQAQDGDALLNRDVEVRVAPHPEAAVVRKLAKGQTVAVFGMPRRTDFVWIGRAGQSLGYVPAETLDPVWSDRPVEEEVALIDRRQVGESGQLPGTHVVAKAVGSGRQGLARGAVVRVESVSGGVAQVSGGAGKGAKGTKVPLDSLRPIVGVRQDFPGISGEAPSYYLSKLGNYVGAAEAEAAWRGELAFVAERQAQATPFIYPTVRNGRLSYSVASGPLTRADAEALCIYASRRGRDCTLVRVDIY
ncbi:hypothetical protein [Arenibaculum pallidiluteum]|uniref:hypothetical protein n=1 Tax=Arenibaculum pallidiluteum TaxID=2812559 RepID=UPI001A961130|nr:hypothetical protein [Arenibaculum pallidiluteum]